MSPKTPPARPTPRANSSRRRETARRRRRPAAKSPEAKSRADRRPRKKGIDPQTREQIAREIRARAAKQLDESIAALGLTNPYTKEPIKNKADYDAYRAKLDEDRRTKLLKKAGMTEEEFAKLAAEQPEIKAQPRR